MIVWSVYNLSHPLRQSEERIRKNILSEIPIGTHVDEVKKEMKIREWNDEPELLFGHYATGGRRWEEVDPQEFSAEGVIYRSYLDAHIGEYDAFFNVSVNVYFIFDESSQLIRVDVKKDAL